MKLISLWGEIRIRAYASISVGNGRQDVSVNGLPANQNNYSMDGTDIVSYTSGMAEQGNAFAGIPIPNLDTIAEFKVQTSQYDAGFGRNPGANVEVITKGDSNNFHGDVFEFNRNNFFNANDFPYKMWEAADFAYSVNASVDKWRARSLTAGSAGGTCGLPDESTSEN